MPQLGETVADGTVTKWFKTVGDAVVRGEPLFEVSTDKVDTEIPAQASGILSAILVAEGVTVDVGTVLAVIGDGSEASIPQAKVTKSAVTSEPVPARASSTKQAIGDTKLSPVVRRLLEEHGLSAAEVTGTGPGGRITRDDVVAASSKNATSTTTHAPPSLSPVVRRLLSDHGIAESSVVGTGPEGRITRRDVELRISTTPPEVSRDQGDEIIPFSKIRRLTAEHMVRSKATSAHTLMVKEVDYERVDIVRRSHAAAFKEQEGFSLTYLPFIALAAVEALKSFPNLNASVGVNELIVHRNINLGIAVDLDTDGLVVPVVHHADGYTLRSIARKVRDLATRAREKKLGVDDFAGGTFTITNPGPFGTLLTGAVINQPQVAILSTDGVSRKPVVVNTPDGGESIAIHSIGLLALTFDHRAVDGAYAARYLRHVAEILNSREWTQEF
jgi:2-oxoglutarate dehydrogenase E2 component (dihydrolipoamide succinyltransferase)